MAEVTKQLVPLSRQVDKLGSNIDRLFNSNGGPEGFLQGARREDNTRFETEKRINDGRFDMIFQMFQEFKDDLKPLKAFMAEHLTKEQQVTVDKSELNRKLNIKLVVGGLILSFVSILSANISSCKNAAKSFISDPQSNHSQNRPQDSALPQGYTHP